MKNKAFLLVALLFCHLAFAQDVNEEISVRMVELDVKVTDWQQRTIGGLSKADFSVLENGKPMKIASFEEVTLTDLSSQEAIAYQPRMMIVLDFKNNNPTRMRQLFPVLRDYVKSHGDEHLQMGLAINGFGIGVVQNFTEDRDLMIKAIDTAESEYNHSPFRMLRFGNLSEVERTKPIVQGLGVREDGHETPDPQPLAANIHGDTYEPGENPAFARIADSHFDRFMLSELDTVRQFVNYLSAYEGKKNVVLISELWDTKIPQQDLRAIVTTCLEHKISLNVLAPANTDWLIDSGSLTADIGHRGVGIESGLASNTSGYSANVIVGTMGENLERVVRFQSHYYRVRYYSEVAGKDYRKVKINVAKGLGYEVHAFSGYLANSKKVPAAEVTGSLTKATLADADLTLSLNTDWMDWTWDGLNRRLARYAIGQHAYDADGNMIAERVEAGSLVKRKFNGKFEEVTLEKSYTWNLADPTKVARLTFTIVDLETGKKVEVQKI